MFVMMGGGGEGHFIAHDYGVIDFKSVGIQRCGHLVTNASALHNIWGYFIYDF